MSLNLDEIEARAAKATPGPWTVSEEGPLNHAWISTTDGDLIARVFLGSDKIEATNAFIAHARTDIPAMAAKIRELEAERERLSKLVKMLRDDLANSVNNEPAGECEGCGAPLLHTDLNITGRGSDVEGCLAFVCSNGVGACYRYRTRYGEEERHYPLCAILVPAAPAIPAECRDKPLP